MEALGAASRKFITGYKNETPGSLKLIDVYLVYIMLTGISQFVYMILAGTFPYNAFLGGFISTVGSFVLAGKFLNFINIDSIIIKLLYSQFTYPNQLPE
jgi:oligosaccharyltransferase complex subunit epsilon